MWKGAIGFGLVSIPIELQAAAGDHDIHFHQVHARDGGRIRQKRVCEAGGHEVEYRDLARGYTAPDGRQAILTDDDLEDELPLPSKRLIDVLAFVDAKLKGTQPPHGEVEEPDTSGVVDLMAALQASMDATEEPGRSKRRTGE